MSKTEQFDIQSAYAAAENKNYIFEDNNLNPVAGCKAIELPDKKAYCLPVMAMAEDWFADGKTEKPKKSPMKKDPIAYLCQDINELYGLVGFSYVFGGDLTEPTYTPIKQSQSEQLHVVNGTLLDAFAVNTSFKEDSTILCASLEGFRIPLKLQSKVKYITIWLNHTSNELMQDQRHKAAKAIAELYGNLADVRICIAPEPQREQIEVCWFNYRSAILSTAKNSIRLRSSKGRYPSPDSYLVYKGKEIIRVEDGQKIKTSIHDALFVDQIHQPEPSRSEPGNTVTGTPIPSRLQVHTLQTNFTLGYALANGSTVLIPVGGSFNIETQKHTVDSSGRTVQDSLSLLANAGFPISVDNLKEVRRLILASKHISRGVGNGSKSPFVARADKTFTKDHLQLAEFY